MLLAPFKLIGRCLWRSKDDTQIAHADSQHYDPKGGNSNEVNQHGMQAQQAHGTTSLYMEHQVRKFCQVHALNAMLSRNAIQLETMLKFCEKHANDSTALGQNLRLGIGWCSRDGSFGDMMIDAFLQFHSVPRTRLYSVAQNIPMGSGADMYLRGLPAGQNAFVLRWHCGNMRPAKVCAKIKGTQQTGIVSLPCHVARTQPISRQHRCLLVAGISFGSGCWLLGHSAG